jgi:glycine/D-amino acid oxidase-like deaminating enzyme
VVEALTPPPEPKSVPGLVEGYRGLSFWHESVPDDLTPRPALPGDGSADVAIVGGGLTGLWTAYYLLRAKPDLRIVVLEKEIAGFGASGRNGGWCSALFPRGVASLAKAHGLDAALALRRAMIASVDEVGAVSASEGIDCDFVKGGTIAFARTAAQSRAADAEMEEAAHYGTDPLERHGTFVFDPHCARLHPAKLVRGLARAFERRGGVIYEQTEVTGWSPGSVMTNRGIITAGTGAVSFVPSMTGTPGCSIICARH